jgi:hypothetical protein
MEDVLSEKKKRREKKRSNEIEKQENETNDI